MTTKLGKWASNDGQITKSKPSDGRRAKFVSLATGFDYDWLRFKVIWEMSDQIWRKLSGCNSKLVGNPSFKCIFIGNFVSFSSRNHATFNQAHRDKI